MADCNISYKDIWHKSLKSVPKIEHLYTYFIVKQRFPVKQSIDRDYKFFSESYIHEFEGKCGSFPVNKLKGWHSRSHSPFLIS